MISPMKTYTGGCHCGKVRFEVATDLGIVISCNCSYCAMRGLLLTFVPASQFTREKGKEVLTEYRFNTMKIRHLFCKHCGIEAFGMGNKPDGSPTVAINIRCLDGIDLDALTLTPFDGKSK